MRKLLEHKFLLYVAIAVIVCVTAYLVIWCNIGGALCVYAIFLTMGIIGDSSKNYILHWSPLVTYLFLVVIYAVDFSLEDEWLREEKGKDLANVVIYGSIMLLTIPLFYYNRSFK